MLEVSEFVLLHSVPLRHALRANTNSVTIPWRSNESISTGGVTMTFPQRGSMRFNRWSIALIISLAVTSGALAEEDCPTKEQILTGLKNERGKLLKGVFHVTGENKQAQLGYGTADGIIKAFGAFDSVRKQTRWDREEPAVFILDGKVTPLRIALKYVRTPELTLAIDDTSGLGTSQMVRIEAPNRKAPNIARPFDARSFGLLGWSSIEGGTLENALKNLQVSPFTEIKRDRNGLCQVTLELRPDVRKRLWIDCERGFTVVRSELDTLDKRKDRWTSSIEVADLKWDQRNSVWVPTSLHLQRHFNEKESYSVELAWTSVNEDVDPKLFELGGLGLDPDDLVVDARGQQQIVIGTIEEADLSRLAPSAPANESQ